MSLDKRRSYSAYCFPGYTVVEASKVDGLAVHFHILLPSSSALLGKAHRRDIG